jgi:prepilin-type N-terminal cleavage/methylation domain-containing protein
MKTKIRHQTEHAFVTGFSKQKYQNGFTLIETLVAISIFVASVTVLLVVTGGGIKDVNSAQNKLTATYLAQEGAELVRASRDTYFMEEFARQTLNGFITPPPTMNRLTQFCNTKNGAEENEDTGELIHVAAFDWCHALSGAWGDFSGNIPWAYNPNWITSNPTATDDQIARIAGPLGPCNRVTGNGVNDIELAGSLQGCNINLGLDARVCRIRMDTRRWEVFSDGDPTLEEAKIGIATETCAEYFYNEGVFRPKWTMQFDGNGDPVYPLSDLGTFSGFSRQIFVDPEYVGGDSDGGMRVTVRVYWIEGNNLRHIRVDDFLTGWPSTVITTP